MLSSIIDIHSREWAQTLESVAHDVFHIPGYASVLADHDGGSPRAYWATDGNSILLIPMILRQVTGQPDDLLDATSPYGYPGPVLHQDSNIREPSNFLDNAISVMPAVLADHGVVSFFMRSHPTNPISTEPLHDIGTLVQHGETVFIDLSLSDEELWSQTRSGHRNEINRAFRNGQRVIVDERCERLDEFFHIYSETMSRLDASSYYFFSREFFGNLKGALGPQLFLALVEIDGDTAAAGLFTESCGTVQYFLSGARATYQKQQPTKMMLHHMRSWAKERGNHTFHLGGGLGGKEDSLFRFKAGFSKCRAPFFTWRLIADQSTYDELVADWVSMHGPIDSGIDGFFPAYRRPQPAQAPG